MKITSKMADSFILLIDELTDEDQVVKLRSVLKAFKGNGPKTRVQAAIRQRKAALNDLAFSHPQMP